MNTSDLQHVFAATAEATRIERARCLEAIASVPELPGEMPDEMWNKVMGDRDAMTEALRIAVRKTKEEAADAINAA